MKSIMKSTEVGMNFLLKRQGNEYEIDNEIPEIQEWKIHWKRQGINMKFTMKYLRYKNEKSIESARE